MLNERDDKYEGHEESEYHFSDEDTSYEVEPESPKPAANEPKESIVNRLAQSKRMLISVGVFLVLVFVVYKMVAPSSSTVPPTEISAPPAPMAQQKTPQAPKMQQNPAVVVTGTTLNPNNMMAPITGLAQTGTPPTATQPIAEQALAQMAQAPNTVIPVTGKMPATVGAMPVMSTAQQTGTPQQQIIQPTMAAPVPQPQPMQMTTGMPSMVPVQSAVPVNQPGSLASPETPAVSDTGNMSSANEKLIAQLGAGYAQKLNDYATQNKALQDQVQVLNARVASMETQMNQLVRALTHQNQASENNVPAAEPQAFEPKTSYNVQAIIPGRAWLRSDNGETVTVAEGDIVKDLGRVSKIDPYDGVVEINTGSKMISLSYGNGG
jgi:hypothetical protein